MNLFQKEIGLHGESFQRASVREMKDLVLSLLLSSAIVLISANETRASSPPRSVIRLHCAAAPASVPSEQAAMMCQQMIQALAESAPGSVIRRVPDSEARLRSPEEVLVALNIVDPKTVYATWRQGPAGPDVMSETLSLDVPIGGASPSQLKAIAYDVLRMPPSVLKVIDRSYVPHSESKP